MIVVLAVVVFRAYSAYSERRLREVDRTLAEASRQAATDLFDEACRDAASAPCRDLLVHDAVNGAPCAILKGGLDGARAAMTRMPRSDRETAAWQEAEALVKGRCP